MRIDAGQDVVLFDGQPDRIVGAFFTYRDGDGDFRIVLTVCGRPVIEDTDFGRSRLVKGLPACIYLTENAGAILWPAPAVSGELMIEAVYLGKCCPMCKNTPEIIKTF